MIQLPSVAIMEGNDNGNGNGNDNSNGNGVESGGRWTCEACGCNTNSSSDRSCSICGTSSGPSILRRAGYAARAGIFSRGGLPGGIPVGLGGRRGFMNDDIDELWGRVVDGVGFGNDEDEEAITALAMEVSGQPLNRSRDLGRPRNFSSPGRETTAVDADEVLDAATENARGYQPKWISPGVGGRVSTGNGMEIGEGQRQNVAHLPVGAGEGRAVRAEEAIPRSIPLAALVPSSRGEERRIRRSFGFKVAFDYPGREGGSSLGGCYMIGVTTSSFSNFGERNGLQQSSLFWGIEDGGNKFEGPRYSRSTRSGGPGISNYGMEIGQDEAPLNFDNVLFGAREVVTVVVDFESRTLTFWRNEQLLGTLVSNLPRGSGIYPVAVPYSAGATVAITAMDGDPLALLRTFSTGWREEQQMKDGKRRQELQLLRSVLIHNGEPTAGLMDVLRTIFSWYAKKKDGDLKLDQMEAARLWYRCGMKLKSIESYFIEEKNLTFEDFLNLVKKIIAEDTAEACQRDPPSRIVVGDKVELAEGWEGKGDAAGGPLLPGDRGVVVELQQGPNGDRHSVRVLFGCRRWWYQPQAVVSEASGLIESSSAWFLHRVLRAHGYDHTTLQSFVGKAVTGTSWECGDTVVPKKVSSVFEPDSFSLSPMDSVVGRIVPNSVRYSAPISRGNISGRSADATTVPVEFVNENFIASTGLPVGTEVDDLSGSLEIRHIRINNLVHSSMLHGVAALDHTKTKQKSSITDPRAAEPDLSSPESCCLESQISMQEYLDDKTRKHIVAISKLEVTAIEAIASELKSRRGQLPQLFSAGLPDAISSALRTALDEVMKASQMPSFSQTVGALGELIVRVIEQLFDPPTGFYYGKDSAPFENNSENEVMDDDVVSDTPSMQQHNDPYSVVVGDDEATDGNNNRRLPNLQQRRNMLLALMSRARRSNTGSLNELIERENGDLGLREMLPGLNAVRLGQAARPSFAGLGVDMADENWEDFIELAEPENGRRINVPRNLSNSRRRQPSASVPTSFLSSLLQGSTEAAPSANHNSGAPVSLTRCLVLNGLLANSLTWVDAVVDVQNRRRLFKSGEKVAPVLRRISDEDGVPVLLVAISLGCSVPIVKSLVQSGAPVGCEEVRKAAYTNQPLILAVLLQHVTYRDGMVDLSKCTGGVVMVVEKYVALQMQLEQEMNKKRGAFVSQVLKRLVRFCLACRSRRHCSTHLNLCSEAMSAVVSGYSLLGALQKTQNSQERLYDTVKTQKLRGLLDVVPAELLVDLFRDMHHGTPFWLLIEDHLYSKQAYDGAVGLTLLRSMLKKLPFLSSSTEMNRYGFAELVAVHETMALKRLEGDPAKKPGERTDASSGVDQEEFLSNADGCIFCPAKHAAVLHITRHSSFRCDLCGAGVERGNPMYGCRECDWDACEKCTDDGTAIAKNLHVTGLSKECQQLLNSSSGDLHNGALAKEILQNMSSLDSTSELHSLSICLQQQDYKAVQELATMLEEPGRITIHQFSKMVLPSLYASLLGQGPETERSGLFRGSWGHRNKKARVGSGSFRRSELLSEIVELLLGISDAMACECGDMEPSNDETNSGSPGDAPSSGQVPRVIERLQQILSFYETAPSGSLSVSPGVSRNNHSSRGALKSLTKPIAIQLCPSSQEIPANSSHRTTNPVKIQAEPLVGLDDLELHILRTCTINQPSYVTFCQELATDQAIIVEQARFGNDKQWRLGRVIGYDDTFGCHSIQYAAPWTQRNNNGCLETGTVGRDTLDTLHFKEKETRLVLGAREYYILRRRAFGDGSDTDSQEMEILNQHMTDAEALAQSVPGGPSVGMRVESNSSSSQNAAHTILAIDQRKESPFVVVSDSGEVWNASLSQLRLPTNANSLNRSGGARDVDGRRQDRTSHLGRSFPFFAGGNSRREVDIPSSSRIGIMKRTWSALSLVESMRPIELSSGDNTVTASVIPGVGLALSCHQGMVVIDERTIEVPLLLRVGFSAHDTLPTVCLRSKQGLPLIGALKQLSRRSEPPSSQQDPLTTAFTLYYSIRVGGCPGEKLSFGGLSFPSFNGHSLPANVGDLTHEQSERNSLDIQIGSANSTSLKKPSKDASQVWFYDQSNRSRKVSLLSPFFNDEDRRYHGLCEGLSDTCVQCMEVLGVISEFSERPSNSGVRTRSRLFENPVLSEKLVKELDDPLSVAGRALPEWCTIAPMFAPRLFSYDSRRLLLDRAAFGVSRAVLKQQESKVNIGRLRQRMASLRGRAVELVGEAFSGGAEDPTSLQLQADELYGMEESLGNRVRATFRAEEWEEHALEVAKVAVERDRLLSDTERIMEKIAQDDKVSKRRLEIRFENESGFDAAAGDEAGVTRGFYADVAEALLSCDSVAGAHCPPVCSNKRVLMDSSTSSDLCKLPLFIPDMDSNARVIIPTPRSDPRSGLGVFPRALSSSHPLLLEVLARYRLIGRLFAAAMRDGFMFPLPLSSSFLKLVQQCGNDEPKMLPGKELVASGRRGKSLQTREDPADEVIAGVKGSAISHSTILTTTDLPRPGFLGGEVYAVEVHICRALDRIDAIEPPLSRHDIEAKYQEVATDKNFARVALGKSYDCSFEEYFHDRTFVDPLDPAQGEEATPLCSGGHKKQVTIHNVRDWVALAKQFLLHDGVLAQAQAFRSGVDDFFHADYLRLFTPEELQRDVCGVGDNVDHWTESDIRELVKLDGGKGAHEALVAVAAIGGEGGAALSRRFSTSSPTISFLVKALLEGTPTQRRQFLSFVTSVPIVTPGKIEVVPIVSAVGEFLAMRDPGCLPRANTCARRLYLPKFETYDSFAGVLWAVVREESKFKGFYEWRGS